MCTLKRAKNRFSRRGYEEMFTNIFNNKTQGLFLSGNSICLSQPIFRCVCEHLAKVTTWIP